MNLELGFTSLESKGKVEEANKSTLCYKCSLALEPLYRSTNHHEKSTSLEMQGTKQESA